MKSPLPLAAALLLASAAPALAQTPATVPAPAAPRPAPKLIVAISVDQFSADLFAQYRNRFTGGMARLLNGAVFPSGYQSHAATETCPGHSTILTGYRPAHTGIIANNWIDQSVGLEDKVVYCAEDTAVPGSTHNKYTVTDRTLKVPTLGERMKAANPATRVVSVAGKDRAAVMMGGHKVDELWWWDGKTYSSYAGRAVPPVVQRTRDAVAALIARPQGPLAMPEWCKPLDRPVTVNNVTVGQGRFERDAGDATAFRASPAADAAVLAMAAGLVQDMKLGKGPAPDLIAIGLSATDYIGHSRGTQGTEMCIQMDQLDQALAGFFQVLDESGIDYEVMLTADHGAHDMTERQIERAMPMETHVSPEVQAKAVGAAIAKQMKLEGPVLLSAESDVYVDRNLPAATRARVLAEAKRRYSAMPQVAAALTRDEIAATPMPTSPPETWTLAERARASFDPERSGDLLILLKPRVTTIEKPGPGYVETHGSPWDYDRRVPILFWRKGMTPFEQPLSVETVDIVPTLGATIGLKTPGVDGRCLDLDPGPADTCAK
ncbi:alkaline phosphatase family protein [Sphingomonas abaci]|uniref:Alkaline phosphatase n=1 Tax=Sphingomonas abaci TaxID=237611 RepID=A0A7W7AIS8_9SPHN|nr:alkaline phosphatase family protein [Sphingomonas abaci]MBB4617803.1 putative AlkP superfamily pyrophosphatase or phosphodiesterase [Sphingomonas abaci]